jgi:hypothetical protein
MRQKARRLRQNQAPPRIARHNSPTHRLPRQIRVIRIDIEAEQRQSKALLSRPGPMTRPAVAALLGKHRFDMIAEAPGEGMVHTGHRYFRGRCLFANFRHNRRLAIGYGHGHAIVNFHNCLITRFPLDSLPQLSLELLPVLPLHDNRLQRFGVAQFNLRRQNHDAAADGICSQARPRRE